MTLAKTTKREGIAFLNFEIFRLDEDLITAAKSQSVPLTREGVRETTTTTTNQNTTILGEANSKTNQLLTGKRRRWVTLKRKEKLKANIFSYINLTDCSIRMFPAYDGGRLLFSPRLLHSSSSQLLISFALKIFKK